MMSEVKAEDCRPPHYLHDFTGQDGTMGSVQEVATEVHCKPFRQEQDKYVLELSP
jgi:hypothetical protein